jgi:hypothetical protein
LGKGRLIKNRKNYEQWNLLYVITLGQMETANKKGMKTITGCFYPKMNSK